MSQQPTTAGGVAQRRRAQVPGGAGGPGGLGSSDPTQAVKLAANPTLRAIVEEKLQRWWSPQQIAGWLQLTYPKSPEMQVSHESSYRTLYVQSRGALNKELTRYLRTGRVIRRPKGVRLPDGLAPDRTRCTSPSGQPRSRTVRCPGTGKETWSSARE